MPRPQPTTPIFRRDKIVGEPNVIGTTFPYTPTDFPAFATPADSLGYRQMVDPRVIIRYGAYHVIATTGGNPTPATQVSVVDFLSGDHLDPPLIGSFTSNPAPAHSGLGMFPTDALIRGTTLFLANEVWGGFWTIDLTNPAAPTNLVMPGVFGGGTLPFVGLNAVFRAEWHPDNRYIVYSARLDNRISILDTTTGLNVANVSVGGASSGGPTALAVWGGYAAVKVPGSTGGGFEINQLRIFDIDPPASLAQVGVLQGTGAEFSAGSPAGGMVYDLGLLYVTNRIGGDTVPTESGVHLSVVDVSNPAAPFFVSKRTFTTTSTALSTSQMIKVGNLLYCLDGNQHSFLINVTDPSNPTLVSAPFMQPSTTTQFSAKVFVWEPSIDNFILLDESFDRTHYITPNDFVVGH